MKLTFSWLGKASSLVVGLALLIASSADAASIAYGRTDVTFGSFGSGIVTSGTLAEVRAHITESGWVEMAVCSGGGYAAVAYYYNDRIAGVCGYPSRESAAAAAIALCGNDCVVDSENQAFDPATTGTYSCGTVTAPQSGCGALAPAPTRPTGELIQSTLDFGSQPVHTSSAEKTATFRNGGSVNLVIDDVTSPGTGFEMRSASTCGDGSVLAPGATCTVKVVFVPASAGSNVGSIDIVSDASNSPHRIELRGTGDGNALGVSPTALNFAETSVGGSDAQTAVVTNTGTGTVLIDSVSASGSAFTASGCNDYLAPGATCTITITFRPQASGSSGGTLTIRASTLSEPLTVSLSGTGTTVAQDPCVHTYDPTTGKVTLAYVWVYPLAEIKASLTQDTRYSGFVAQLDDGFALQPSLPAGCRAATVYSNNDLSIPTLTIGNVTHDGPFTLYYKSIGGRHLFVHSATMVPGVDDASLRPDPQLLATAPAFAPDTVLLAAQHWLCVDAPRMELGVGLVVNACNFNINEQFKFDGEQIKMFDANTCLDGSGGENAQVKLATCDGSTAQKWWFTQDGVGGQLQNQANNLCLDVKGGGTTNQTPVILYDCAGGNPSQRPWNQRFTKKDVAPYYDAKFQNKRNSHEFCFGAVGKACDGAGTTFFDWMAQGTTDALAYPIGCDGADEEGNRNCWVAAGSIKHDNCCRMNPTGKMCGGDSEDAGLCSAEWDQASDDVWRHRAWRKVFDARMPADLTVVSSERYPLGETEATKDLCAPSGDTVAVANGAGFCCSKRWKDGLTYWWPGETDWGVCE